MRGRPIGLVTGALLAVAVLGACSPEPEPYADLSDLAAAVSEAGVGCDRLERGPRAQLVSDWGTCAGSDITVYLFDDAGDLEDWRTVGTRLGPALIGPNWAATGSADDLGRVADELGGDLTSSVD